MKGREGGIRFFGPYWLVSYVIAGNSGGDTQGKDICDWAVCDPPAGFFGEHDVPGPQNTRHKKR
jgi:hypothetical protein